MAFQSVFISTGLGQVCIVDSRGDYHKSVWAILAGDRSM